MKQAVLVAWLCLLGWPVMAQGTFRVRFAQPAYSIAPGTSTAVSVLIDPVPEPGLFSFGLKMAFDEAMARVESASSISIPPPLDFNGVLGPGAIKSVGSGFATAKGTVDFFVTPVPYAESLLATFVLSDQSGAVGQSYSITLDIHRTLGPAESVFVTGAGGVLDLQLGFGSALVTVVPEPGSWLLILAGGCVLWVSLEKRQRCLPRNGLHESCQGCVVDTAEFGIEVQIRCGRVFHHLYIRVGQGRSYRKSARTCVLKCSC